MICVTKTFLKRLDGWVLGWLKRNASNWARQLYIVAILIHSSWIIWQVASGALLLPSISPSDVHTTRLPPGDGFLGGVVRP